MPYLIDEVLPTNRIHLLAGVSDAGKTRLLLPLMSEWQQGNSVLGRKSHPVPWAYVIGDRLEQEAIDSMNSMGINPKTIRCIPAFGRHNKSYCEILLAAAKMDPPPQFLVWEGFSDMCGERRYEVKEFLGALGSYCEGSKEFPHGLTILGVVEAPKQKPYEKYPNPRQRVSGASAWSYHSSTILLLEGADKDEALLTPYRTLWICVKNGVRRKLVARFDIQGRLIVP
jgi:hypothetical protein